MNREFSLCVRAEICGDSGHLSAITSYSNYIHKQPLVEENEVIRWAHSYIATVTKLAFPTGEDGLTNRRRFMYEVCTVVARNLGVGFEFVEDSQ